MLTIRTIRMVLRPMYLVKPVSMRPYKQPLQTTFYMNQRFASDSKKYSIKPPETNLPSREQLQKYFFRATVIVWDTSVYLYTVAARLFDQYVLKQKIFQQYWAEFQTKMDQARREMRSK